MKKFQARTTGSVFLAAALMFFVSTSAWAVENNVPNFSLPALSDETRIDFSEFNRQNPVLLIFWATWCPSCREEIPALNEIYRRLSPKGLRILAVNVEETRKDILKFQKRHPMDYPVVMDQRGDVTEKFGLVGVPAALLAAPGGKVLYFGFSLPENIESIIANKEKKKA